MWLLSQKSPALNNHRFSLLLLLLTAFLTGGMIADACNADAAQNDLTTATQIERVEVGPQSATINANGHIATYRYFALTEPERLVVDIYGAFPTFDDKELSLQGAFRRLRVGTYRDKTRFVLDATDTVPQHNLVAGNRSLEIRWSNLTAATGEVQRQPPASLGHSASEPTRPTATNGVSLDFSDIELADLIKTISDLTGRNFVYDDTIKGKVSIMTPDQISTDEAYQLFLTVLSIKGFTVIPSGRVHKIVREATARETNLPLLTEDSQLSGEQFVTRLLRLEHISAELMAERILTPLMPRTGNVIAYAPANTLIITDSAANIERLLQIIRRLDLPSSVDQLEVLTLQYANAEEVAEICRTVLGQTARQAAARAARPGEGAPASQVIADPRTNSLLVVASLEDLRTIRQLVESLDRQRLQERAPINVYYLENADAEKLAETLNTIIARRPGAPRDPRSISLYQGLSENLSITADKPTNALIIHGTPEDFEQVREIIARLDIRRKQVYVETLILELSMEATKQLGTSLQGAFRTGSGVVSISSGQGIGPASLADFRPAEGGTLPTVLGKAIDGILLGGLFSPISVTGPDGNLITVPAFSALIDLSKTDSDVNILSAPRLLTSDNEEAEIIVGANVPIITQRLTDTGGGNSLAQSVSVERKDVALTLRFTPQITEGDLVRLNVYQEITNIVPEASAVGDINQVGPTLTKRLLRNTVLAEDGQTVVLGGLISNNQQNSVSKVPLLGDIPVLGHLFKHTRTSESKTNLLVFITPRIIYNRDDLAAVTRRSSRAMEAFRPDGAPALIPAELLGNDLLYVPFEYHEPAPSAP